MVPEYIFAVIDANVTYKVFADLILHIEDGTIVGCVLYEEQHSIPYAAKVLPASWTDAVAADPLYLAKRADS